jgi:CheY-like chemotaxis protein
MTNLTNCHILLVEDEYMLARHLKAELENLGAVIIGPVPSVKQALELVAQEPRIDVSILDVNLGGVFSFPVADALIERMVPFVFSTGYDDAVTTGRYPGIPKCDKPYVMGRLLKAIHSLITPDDGGGYHIPRIC